MSQRVWPLKTESRGPSLNALGQVVSPGTWADFCHIPEPITMVRKMGLQRLGMPESWEGMRACVCVYACAWALGLTEEATESSQETREDGYWLAKPSSSSSEPLPQQPANIVQMAEQLEWMDPYKHVLTPGKWQEALPLMMGKNRMIWLAVSYSNWIKEEIVL